METVSIAQSLIFIVVILGFLCLALWGIRTYGARLGFVRFRQGRDLVLEEHVSLGPKRDACVLRYKNRKYLLGVTDRHISLISAIDPEENLEDPDQSGSSTSQTGLSSASAR